MSSDASFRRALKAPPTRDDASAELPVAAKKVTVRKGNDPSALKEKRRQDHHQRQQRRLQQRREVARLHELQQQVREAQAQLQKLKRHEEEQRQRRNKEMREMLFEYLPSSTAFSTLPQPSPDLLETTTRIGSYQVGKLLGQGGYGKVYEASRLVTDRRTKTTRQGTFALKKIEKRRLLTPRKLEDLNRELQIMQQIRHPNVVRCYQVLNGRDHIHVVLNRASSDLFDYRAKYELTEVHIKVVMIGILQGLEYLHSKGISHLDIKSENVLLLRDVPPHELQVTDVQLCDFGVAVQQEDPNATPIREWRGTFSFMAPELVTAEGGYGPSADMWSFGVTLMEFVLGGMPSGWPMNQKSHLEDYTDRIMDCLEVASLQAREGNCRGWNLISGLLEWVPHNRLTAREALGHPWLSDADHRDDDLRIERDALSGSRQG